MRDSGVVVFVFWACVLLVVTLCALPVRTEDLGHFTSTWAVHIPGGKEKADLVARDHGFINLGEIFNDHYHFHHRAVARRSKRSCDHRHRRLQADSRVHWARQQRIKSRQKRDLIALRPRTNLRTGIALNDQKWPQMWYLNRGSGLDMNVIPAWKEGITGKGVVVTILDDGLEKNHPDLIRNYDPQASYDVNSHDEDPMPRYDMIDSNRHGTRCAGEVAATANNSLCAVGVAYGASVGGVRMLDGDVTDAVEARSLSLNPQHIDIYSASWGPDDDGKTVDGPGELATRAFIEGVTKGRSGKGSIFVWASGNGGREHDNCNCDGYTNSIWTLSISSATERGLVPWYSEMCSSTLATTYSSGAQNEKQVVTTDLHHACTSSHTGTSASAPLAAGICALALEANKDLTWRDMQHIVVRTAKPANLKSDDWATNGVGRNVSHSFGYGLMDAAAMVKLARTWKTVPEQRRCEVSAPHIDKLIPPKSKVVLQLPVSLCQGVNFLEHVQAKISLQSSRRGDIQIHLTSPGGTRVTLLAARQNDASRSGFSNWPFMSVHTWGESPQGLWHLEVHNEGRYMAKLTQWDLLFHGTQEPPQESDLEFSRGGFKGSKSVQYSANGAGNYADGLEHNSLETDTASGQWRDLHHVREGHIDVQRTASDDVTSSACISYNDNHNCLECMPDTYLFEGHCYTNCPAKSFLSVEPNWLRATTRSHNKKHLLENLWSSFATRNRRAIRRRSNRSVGLMVCLHCHYSCLTCRGPTDHECLTCNDDAVLTNKTENDNFCYPLAIMPQIQDSAWFYRLYVTLIVVISIILCLIACSGLVYVLGKCINKILYLTRSNKGQKYDKIATQEVNSAQIDIADDNQNSVDESESEF